ncbi:MAG: Smr/MutS family protein [Polyangiaceae bacterium]
MSSPCPPKTAADLEFPRILRALADRCASDAGRSRALALPFLDRAGVVRALAEVREATALVEAGSPLPRSATPPLEDALARARVGALLSSEELTAILLALGHARALRRFVRARREEIPKLSAACDSSPDLDALLEELDRCFEADGTLSDRASQRLADLRSERRSGRARILARLDELIGRYKDILQDGFFTEREGRYVLPVRADAHERFPGIVHSASAGGGTLFVEPRVIVPMGNRQKVLDAQVKAEEDAILARLSGLVAASVDPLADALEALAHADLRGASADLRQDLDLSFPILADGATVALRKARHPILALDGTSVVPSDIELASGSALVVSGPNAGGKTVALKTVGLAALMVRAGLPIPAGRDSTIGLFDEVLTDVGDDQSLTKNLSTFSAHVRNLADIVEHTHVGTLVLLDELASGTDPREGEALATAVLESLVARGGAVACTTHYERLKVVALEDARFRNASVGFDLQAMSPTFRLALGVAGASSALVVARRFGIPEAIVGRAEALLSAESSTLSALVRKLDEDRLRLERMKDDLDRAREELEEERASLAAARERAEKKEAATVEREANSLISEVRQAREDVRAAKVRLRSAKLDARDLASIERQIDGAASAVSIGGRVDSSRPVPADRAVLEAGEIAVGMRVFVPRLKTDAEVLEVLSGGQLRVAAGPLKLLTSASEVRRATSQKSGKGADPSGGARAKKPSLHVFDAASDSDVPMQTSDNTIDLRGLRAHEALALAEQFLDRCVGASKRVAFLIHGHGTGALRRELRDMVRASPYVERSRPGEPREGGDGVTVVWLK